MKRTGLFLVLLFGSMVQAQGASPSCVDLFSSVLTVVEMAPGMQISRNPENIKTLTDYYNAEALYYSERLQPPFNMLAHSVSYGYAPARAFIMDIAKYFMESKDIPDPARQLANYYEHMLAFDITGENVVRFAEAVKYSVEEGAAVINRQRSIEKDEKLEPWELEGLTVDQILKNSIH